MTRTPMLPLFRLSPLLFLIATCCPTTVLAQGAAPVKGPAMFWYGDLDRNHDGRIDKQEAAAAPGFAKAFDQIDANHDGAITMSEIKAMWRAEMMQQAQASVQMRMAAFAKADTKHAGKISSDQAKAGGMPFVVNNFKAFDADKDGFVSKDEMQKGATAVAQQVLAGRGQQLQALFTKADTNKDGKLDKAEFTAAFPRFAPSFAFFDESHDGFVELAEFALPPGL